MKNQHHQHDKKNLLHEFLSGNTRGVKSEPHLPLLSVNTRLNIKVSSQMDMSDQPFFDGGFFTIHTVPNTNIFIIIKEIIGPRYDSCSCEIHKVSKYFLTD